ncbi:Pyrogallol hydroxytransferase, partial [Burkholderia sp. H160]
EGEAQFADIILPACTSLERWDIGEWANSGGYAHHGFNTVNQRMITLQHKCIEPLGESRSDYDIFTAILTRLGLGGVFTDGGGELDWVKRVFESSDLPEPHPMPSRYAEKFGMGLQTPSGKLEFVPELLKRHTADNPERPPVNRYMPSWEGLRSPLAQHYPLQLIATHSRYSFHTHCDGKNSSINSIEDHRALIGGHRFWLLRLGPVDAVARGIAPRDLVKVYNDRGAVICAADVSPLVAHGVVKSYEASAEFQLIEIEGERVEIGGCMNLLTPDRPQTTGTSSMSPNSCLVQVEKWKGGDAFMIRRAA